MAYKTPYRGFTQISADKNKSHSRGRFHLITRKIGTQWGPPGCATCAWTYTYAWVIGTLQTGMAVNTALPAPSLLLSDTPDQGAFLRRRSRPGPALWGSTRGRSAARGFPCCSGRGSGRGRIRGKPRR